MLQFTVDQELKDTLTSNGVPVNLEVGQKVTAIFYLSNSTLNFWYYSLWWFLGDYGDMSTAVQNDARIKLDQIPNDKKVYLYNEDGSDKYTIPPSDANNYGRPIEECGYPLLMNMQEDVSILYGKLESGGY